MHKNFVCKRISKMGCLRNGKFGGSAIIRTAARISVAAHGIDLAGVPQIPHDCFLAMQNERDHEFAEASTLGNNFWRPGMNPEQIERCSRVIWEEAIPEIRRRHEEHMRRCS